MKLIYLDFRVNSGLGLVTLDLSIYYSLCIFIDRILDSVDPSLETYGDPLVWRGSQSEVKYRRALKLPPRSSEVSTF